MFYAGLEFRNDVKFLLKVPHLKDHASYSFKHLPGLPITSRASLWYPRSSYTVSPLFSLGTLVTVRMDLVDKLVAIGIHMILLNDLGLILKVLRDLENGNCFYTDAYQDR